MSTNKSAREKLEKIFGKICMIEAAGIRRIPVSKRMKIKGYKKAQDTITYHHLRERSRGGRTDEENRSTSKRLQS